MKIELGLLSDCNRCVLRAGASQVVLPSGNPQAKLYLLLDHPDDEADLLGRPLAGLDGDYLRDILTKAEIPGEEVYTTYLVKCRPRVPVLAAERRTCSEWWALEQVEAKPRAIIALGEAAGRQLMGGKVPKGHTKTVLGRLTACWHSPYRILNGGAKLYAQTLDLFRVVKEHLRA